MRYTYKVNGVTHATCWAHTRRKFIEAEASDASRCQKALEYIRVLSEIEASVRESDSEDIVRARRERSLPVVGEFFEWLGTELADLTILPSSPFPKAASYAMERKASLSVYLSDPDVPIDTNHLEKALRPPWGARTGFSAGLRWRRACGKDSVLARHMPTACDQSLYLLCRFTQTSLEEQSF